MKGIRLSGPQSVEADQENPRLISDLMYRIYVREAIEAGIKNSDQGRTVDVKEVRRGFGLSTLKLSKSVRLVIRCVWLRNDLGRSV